MNTIRPASDSLALLLDPEGQYLDGLPVKTLVLSDGKHRVCVYGSHRWTSFERDYDTQAEAEATYSKLIQEPLLNRAVLHRHGLRQS